MTEHLQLTERKRCFEGLRFLFAALALIALTCVTHAASPPMYFDRYDRDSGLSQLTVLAIAQDATGFLWVGTEDGLDRFDGYVFHQPNRDAGDSLALTNQFVAHIERDAHGALWLATDGGSVLRRDASTGRFESLSALARGTLDPGLARVRTLRFDRTGHLWIATRDAGLARFDARSGLVTRYRHNERDRTSLASDSLHALLEDRQGTLWIGTAGGLDSLDVASGRFTHHALPVAGPALIRALLQDRAGSIWVATNVGLVQLGASGRAPVLFTHEETKARSLPANAVNTLLEDRAGRLWIGTTAGLALFDPASREFDIYRRDPADPRSLPDDNINALFEDSTGLLWVGTRFGGLAKWNPRTWSFGHHPATPDAGFASQNIMAFTEDAQRRMWIGTFDGGITVVDRTGVPVFTLRRDGTQAGSLSDDHVMTLLTDHEGIVWAGTMNGGLNRIDPRTLAVTAFRHDPADANTVGAPGVMSLFEDSAHRLWVGTYGGGLSRFDRVTRSFERYRANPADQSMLASDRVTALMEDVSGMLWVGTDGGGLHALNPATGKFVRFRQGMQDAHSLNAPTIYSLHRDRRGQIWVGTRAEGLMLVSGSPRSPQQIELRHFTEKNGLPNNSVYGIRSDQTGAIWVSTNYGIARVDPQRGTVRAFHRAQGLQGEEFTYGAHYMNRAGMLFFGGANGYNAFVPAALEFNTTPPQIVLTSLSVVNRPVIHALSPGSAPEIQLPYRDDVVTFEFAALDYTAPLHNMFQYRLDGAERKWVNAGSRRSVTYAHLPGGHYSLRVRAANADGTWNTAGISIPMTIDPPPWKSGWAYATYALLTALAIFACWCLHKQRLAREAAYSRRLEQQVRERTRDLVAHSNALEQANRRLEEASFTDPLTGLGNRRSLKHCVPQMLANLPRGGRIALMVVDLDRMKPVNDEHGHDAGDRMLTAVARILRESIRGSDNVVRWGGDEFVVMHACDNLDSAAQLAERIRRSISTHRYALANGSHVRTSCSIGFALYPFVRAMPGALGWEDVLKLADSALYRAKARRNAWVGWSGQRAVPDLAERVILDPEAAEAERLIRMRISAFAAGETIEMLLLRPQSGRSA